MQATALPQFKVRLGCPPSLQKRQPNAPRTARQPAARCAQEKGESLDLSAFSLIIDDIVYPDGRTQMGVLGGGGPQTLFGYQLFHKGRARVGLAAGVGRDLPPHCKSWLQSIGTDLSGLLESELPTPRAWQLLEEDGRRTQVWRSPVRPELYKQLRPDFASLPYAYQQAEAYHLGIHPSRPPLDLLPSLRAAAHSQGGFLSTETFTVADSRPSLAELRQMLEACDIFSPNEVEAWSLVGVGTPEGTAERLLDAGARLVVLRRGAAGALVQSAAGGGPLSVPAYPNTRVVDTTGCGNAFCGAFLAAHQVGMPLGDAALWGSAAASIMAEHPGVPLEPFSGLCEVAAQRFERMKGYPY